MNDAKLLVVTIGALSLLIASAVFCVFLLRKLRRLESQQDRWSTESRRLEQLQGSFLANMSHELRTPLTVIKGYTDLMTIWASSDNLAAKYKDALATIDRNERFLHDILNSILNYSKIRVGLRPVTKERVDISAILPDVLPGLKEKSKSQELFFHIDIDRRVPRHLEFDLLAVRQIIRNLIENAVKFTSKGGITIEVKWTPTHGNENGELMIAIIDTGIGIAASDMERIFEPFIQAESSMSRRYGGTGLGLSISRSLAENMGGALTVQSKPGAGSRFELRLPAKRVTAEPPQQMPVKIAAPNFIRVRKRILVVEDSPDAQNLIRQFLAGVNAELVSVENGKEAIDAVTKAEQDKEGFDVVLMDMQMPVMNGFQATRILRQRGFRKPIIAVTAHSLEGDREKCLESGCSDYVSKPIDWSVLISKLEAA